MAWVLLPITLKINYKGCTKYETRKIKLEDLFEISYGLLNTLNKRKISRYRKNLPDKCYYKLINLI